MKNRSARASLLLLVVASAPACYTYGAAAPTALVPGHSVRITLTDAEALQQRSAQGALSNVIEGAVALAGPDTIALVVRARSADGSGFNRSVVVPRTSILNVEEKRFSAARTAVAAGAAAGAVALALAINAGGTQDGEDPPIQEFWRGLFRLLSPAR